ncbi:hypothetical protein J2W54_005101, partial [Rhodococcus fascians]|nr:hypothetical protein [Rhodococcus fascians]
ARVHPPAGAPPRGAAALALWTGLWGGLGGGFAPPPQKTPTTAQHLVCVTAPVGAAFTIR